MDSSSPLYMTRLKLAGKVQKGSFIPDDEEADSTEPVDDNSALLEAIADLSVSLKSMNIQTTVDMYPVVESIKALEARITKKRKWKFSIIRDTDGEVSEINATEI